MMSLLPLERLFLPPPGASHARGTGDEGNPLGISIQIKTGESSVRGEVSTR